jgi:hypothetical protein
MKGERRLRRDLNTEADGNIGPRSETTMMSWFNCGQKRAAKPRGADKITTGTRQVTRQIDD